MKLKKLFGGLLLSSFLAAGLGVSISASNKVVEVNAASVPSGVYVNIDNCQWKDWGAALSNIKAHFFNGGTGYTTWPGTAVTENTPIYWTKNWYDIRGFSYDSSSKRLA